ncbi:MAG: SPFH domain-containing protein [Anaerolineae bacterium]|nr:SPFH domain-containing protein [Anaerolineae bacterium]MDW7990770.1 SPFH domain-containing protein [Anaerolineae bacterium]
MPKNHEAPIPENSESFLESGVPDATGRLRMVHSMYVLAPLLLFFLICLILYGLFPAAFPPWLTAFAITLLLSFSLFLLLLWIWARSRKAGKLVLGILVLLWGALALILLRERGLVLLFGGPLLAFPLFHLGLFLVSGKLLPFPPPDRTGTRRERFQAWLRQNWTVYKILLDHLSGQNYPIWAITRASREEDRIEERLPGDPLTQFAGGQGVILTDCDMAVAVSSGMKFKGVLGPGLIFTSFAERPVQTVDLRPQLRAFWVQAMTRDGIQVKVLAFTPFQIDRGDQQPRLGEPFPFRRSAAFKAIHAQMTLLPESPETQKLSWDAIPQLMGTRILQDILSRYRFDDLYAPYGVGEEPPRIKIAREFRDRLRQELEPLGIQLLGGGISNILPVRPEVMKERIRAWQAEWVRQILVRQAESQRERLWRIEQARAEAQANLILALGERLAELDRSDSPVDPEEIIREFLRILEEMALQPMMHRYLPKDVAEEAHRLLMEYE